jgi:hypothetical protein
MMWFDKLHDVQIHDVAATMYAVLDATVAGAGGGAGGNE